MRPTPLVSCSPPAPTSVTISHPYVLADLSVILLQESKNAGVVAVRDSVRFWVQFEGR